MQSTLTRIGWFILLILLQVLLYNHIHFLGYATPMPYVFFLTLLPSNTPRWGYILWGFVMGIVLDIFSNTAGMIASSLTFTALLTPLLLKVFRPNDYEDNEVFVPSSRTLEWGAFTRFVTCVTLVNTILFFTLEAFSFFNWQYLLINIASSTMISVFFIIAIELIRRHTKKH